MRKRPLTPVGRALFIACTMLVIVLLAFVGLARLAGDASAPAARIAAPPAGQLVAGEVEYDRSALAAERRQDVVGALLMFFLIGGAVTALACAIWAGVLALRGRHAEAAVGEEAFGPR
jgi:hypothetical protein